MKYTKSALGLLNARYRSVLRKCLLINLGLFALGAVAATPANAADAGTWAKAIDDTDAFMDNLAATSGGAWNRNNGPVTGWGVDQILGVMGGAAANTDAVIAAVNNTTTGLAATNTLANANKDAIDILKGDASTTGSVAKSIADALADYTKTTDLAGVATSGAAADVSYDNTTSGLTATNVQAAIDEVVTSVNANADAIDALETTVGDADSGLVKAVADNTQAISDNAQAISDNADAIATLNGDEGDAGSVAYIAKGYADAAQVAAEQYTDGITGDLNDLDTLEQGTLVGAINEVVGDLGDVADDLGDVTQFAGSTTGNLSYTSSSDTNADNAADAIASLDAVVGKIDGLAATLTDQGIAANLDSNSTVSSHLVALASAIGDRSDYTEENYITASETTAESLDALDVALGNVEDKVDNHNTSLNSLAGLVDGGSVDATGAYTAGEALNTYDSASTITGVINKVVTNKQENLIINADSGLKMDTDGKTLSVKLADTTTTKSGLQVDDNGLSVKNGATLEINSEGFLNIKANSNQFEVNNATGLNLADGGVTTSKIDDGAVTIGKIAADAKATSITGSDNLATDRAVKNYVDDEISQEVTRATTAEGQLAQAIETERVRAATAEGDLAQAITDTNTALSDNVAALNSTIAAEANRAATAEAGLGDAINAETARATTAEGQLAQAIDTEKNRAANAEGQLAQAIETERVRAATAEGDLAQAIDTEKNRAVAAETSLAAKNTTQDTGLSNIMSTIGGTYNADTGAVTPEAIDVTGNTGSSVISAINQLDDNFTNGTIDAKFKSADITGDATIGGDLDVTGDTTLAYTWVNDDLDVTGDTYVGGDTYVEGDLTAKSLTFTGDTNTTVDAIDTGTAVVNGNGSATTLATTATIAETVGDLSALTSDPIGVTNADDVASAIQSLGTNVEAATGGEFAADGKWAATVDNSGAANGYAYTEASNVMKAMNQIAANVGTADQLSNNFNGVETANSVNQNINALNGSVGDVSTFEDSTTGNLSNSVNPAPADNAKDVATAINNIDATLGKIHGLYDGSKVDNGNPKVKSTVGANSNLAQGTTVSDHLVMLDNAIGNRQINSTNAAINEATWGRVDANGNVIPGTEGSLAKGLEAAGNAIGTADFRGTRYAAGAGNVTDAVKKLDANMGRIEHDVRDLRHDFRTGMASMAAMTALVPNARGCGDTSLSLGTGAYDGHTAMALGAFHYLTDNLLLNAGAAWGNTNDVAYRMGVTWSF